MSANELSLYQAPKWGSRVVGVATVVQDGNGTYFVNAIRVASVHTIGLFSVLTCDDGTSCNVLTAFLRLVRPQLLRESHH